MRKFFSIFLILLPIFLKAQTEKNSYVVVKDIVIEGNNVTDENTVLKELTFSLGDTLTYNQWEIEKKASRENILNTTLFNFVTLEEKRIDSLSNDIILNINLTERWYFWLYPYIAYADRNINAWYEADDLSRFSYGFDLQYNNILGLRHTLKLIVIAGYNQNYGISYDLPSLYKNLNLGLEFSASYKRDKEVSYKTENNKIHYFNGGDEFAKQSYNFYIKPYYRFNQRNKLFLQLTYNDTYFNDSLPSLNDDFCCLDDTHFQYFTLSMIYKNDFRDDHNYPLNGHYLELMLEQNGIGVFNTSPDVFYAKFTGDYYRHLAGRWYWASNLTTKLSPDADDVPYFLNQGLGYNNDYVRSYELYVIDAMNYALVKNNLKFVILKPVTKYISILKNERFAKIHFALYANLFFDCAYSWNMPENNTSFLDNKFIFGTGIGLDIVTYYDKVLRLEYGVNDMGEAGLFIHFVAPI